MNNPIYIKGTALIRNTGQERTISEVRFLKEDHIETFTYYPDQGLYWQERIPKDGGVFEEMGWHGAEPVAIEIRQFLRKGGDRVDLTLDGFFPEQIYTEPDIKREEEEKLDNRELEGTRMKWEDNEAPIDEVEADVQLFSNGVYFNGDLAKFLYLDHTDDRGLKVYSFRAEFDEEKLFYDVREYYMRDDGEWDMKFRGLREPIEALETLLARVEAYPEDGILESHYSKTVEVGVARLCRALGKPLPGDRDREETFEEEGPEEGKRYPWEWGDLKTLVDPDKMMLFLSWAVRGNKTCIEEFNFEELAMDPYSRTVIVRAKDERIVDNEEARDLEFQVHGDGFLALYIDGVFTPFNAALVYTELKNLGFLT